MSQTSVPASAEPHVTSVSSRINIPSSEPSDNVGVDELKTIGSGQLDGEKGPRRDNLTLAEEESESDSDQETTMQIQPKVSERRRQQNAIFESWFLEKAQIIAKEDPKTVIHAASDEVLSTRSLISKHESKEIISSAREYQLELFERAKEKNTIAVLDTGSGKTLIAVLLLRHIVDRELEDRAQGKPRRIAFFLVDSVTLVFQQHAVLECNLGANVERFCGEMGCDLWQKEIWQNHFENNMVIVLTAEVLYQCLMHSFISIDQINLLIFDEAHHAKKNHSYARIIKDFYLAEPDRSKRPKIFGMTASPVDARTDVVQAARELEQLLDSQIATTSDLSLLQKSVSRPKEIVGLYEKLLPPFDTPLNRLLKAHFGDMAIFSKFFHFARNASSELGSWFADQVWSFCLSEDEARKLESKIERSFLSKHDEASVVKLEAEIACLRKAREIISKHVFQEPTPSVEFLSHKVLLLHKFLKMRFEHSTDEKCIVFVRDRYSVKLLRDLFGRIGGPNLRPGILVGTRPGAPGDLSVTFRKQVVTLINFRKGLINCLFATSIAEEGLDIPDCNLVIRFNLYGTMIQYIQSRGRARHSASKYIHMIEKGNIVQVDTFKSVKTAEDTMRQFCESLPADRLLKGNDHDLDGSSRASAQPSFTDSETGAKLTYSSCLPILAHFASCLPHNIEATLQPNYVMTVLGKQFVCEVILPENSPIRSAIGHPSPRKSLAKRSAAFEACIALRKGKYLDANLLPIYHKQIPFMMNARLAVGLKNTKAYSRKLKPNIWADSVGKVPDRLFLTVLELSEPDGLNRPYQPLGILTRTPLPSFPRFPVFFEKSKSGVVCTRIAESLELEDGMLKNLNDFTLQIFIAVFAKSYENCPEKTPYWIVPVKRDIPIFTTDSRPRDLIQWDVVSLGAASSEYKWNKDTPSSFYEDKFIVDPHDGGRRFFSVGLAPELKPLDPVPLNTAPGKRMENIFSYSDQRFKSTRARFPLSTDVPVILAQKVLHRRNWLDKITEKEKTPVTKCYVCPGPLIISTIPTSVASMALIFPAIMTRLDSYLIADEVSRMLHLDIRLDLALEAITKDSDNTEEHHEEQIHFQRGMGKNYERLEFLGDCFLKMATSIALYIQNPNDQESDFHVKRMLMVCNKNLFLTAVELKLYEYVRAMGFCRRTWYPDGMTLVKGKGNDKDKIRMQTHRLSDKSIADVSEALIGAALLSRPHGDFDNAVKAVTTLVRNPDHDISKWSDYYELYNKPTHQTDKPSASHIDLAAKVETKHDYHFTYPRLLRAAFYHPSMPWHLERIPSYQRLEFLGDALFDMACVNFLFSRFPDRDPQWLTEHKMAMVSNRFLAAVCVKLDFHRHLRSNGDVVEFQIREYVAEIREAEEESNGSPDYWTGVEAPKALSDMVEAYIGAIFVDSEFNYCEVERFFDAHIKWYFEDMSLYDTFANDHPTTLLNKLMTTNFACNNFRIFAQEIPSIDSSTTTIVIAGVIVHNQIIAHGRASSGKYAKVNASKNALKVLTGLAPFEFRKLYKCNCPDVAAPKKKGDNRALNADEQEDGETIVVGTAI